MKAVNKHGLKMTGLQATSESTKSLQGYYSGHYVEIFYDPNDGEVWGVYQYSLGQNTWTVYHDKSIIKVGNVSDPCTMQQIADKVYNAVMLKEEYTR